MSNKEPVCDPHNRDVAIIGGGGHVGLPLAIALADRGLAVTVYDRSKEAVELIRNGKMPFKEEGAEAVLQNTIASGTLTATTNPESVSKCDSVIVVIGTPVDEHLNPDPNAIPRALEETLPYFHDGQLIVLRSTVYPGVTALVEAAFATAGLAPDIAFCPERIAEGRAMKELYELPQIVGARTPAAGRRAAELFGKLGVEVLSATPEEAELAKLFTNVWRYIKFAAVNQFFMIANNANVDFAKVHYAVTHNYPRAEDMPTPGFAAGPCLFKDTMQLAAFNDNQFAFGHSAMLVNEGLPLYLASRISSKYDLSNMTVGILGMAFKGESDDVRSSLSYKLKRILEFRAHSVVTTDPFVTTDRKLLPLSEVLARSDLLIVGAPHREYASLETATPIVDIWNLRGTGLRI